MKKNDTCKPEPVPEECVIRDEDGKVLEIRTPEGTHVLSQDFADTADS